MQIPNYYVLGSLSGGRLVYFSNELGAYSLWCIEPRTGSKQRLTTKPLPPFAGNIAKPRENVSKVFFARDVAKGAELSQIFWVEADTFDSKEEILLTEMQPMRVMGLATSGDKLVAFTGATQDNLSIYLAREDSIEKVATLDGLAGVYDANEKYVVGSGFLRRNPRSEELFLFEIASSNLKVFTPKEGSLNKMPKLNGSKVLFESNYEDGKSNRLHIHDAASGSTVRADFTSSDYDSFAPASNTSFDWIDSDRGAIWVIGRKDGETKTFVDGKLIPTPIGSTVGATVVGNTIFYDHSTFVRPSRILATEIAGGTTKILIENKIPNEIEEKLGAVRFEKVKSFDGLEVPCFVVESKTAGRPGPAVLYIHGGPTSEIANLWSVLIAPFVVAGYHVVAPNYRGSTGYGEEYKLLNIGDLGGGDMKDMVEVARWAKENGLSDRIAICGYSYGGYSTLLALGMYPEIWACGVAGASIADWEEQYVLADAAFKKIMEMYFDSKIQSGFLKERSPITYADRVKVPLCIIHSQNDTRTPLSPVLKYALKLPKGVSFEMHVKPDLGHTVASIDDIMNIVYPAVEFLSKQMPNRETAPSQRILNSKL